MFNQLSDKIMEQIPDKIYTSDLNNYINIDNIVLLLSNLIEEKHIGKQFKTESYNTKQSNDLTYKLKIIKQ